MKMRTVYIIGLVIIAIAFVAYALIMPELTGDPAVMFAMWFALFVAVTVSVNLMLVKYNRGKTSEVFKVDEMFNRLSAYAAYYSWFITFIFLTVLMVAVVFGALELTGEQAIIGIWLVMLATLAAFRLYFSRRGSINEGKTWPT